MNHSSESSSQSARPDLSVLPPHVPPTSSPHPVRITKEVPARVETPYSIYTTNEKWFIVGLSAFAGLFSGLTSNIYFPAIPVIANAFNKSNELINLTVTVYLVLQGISPMFWGTLSDRYGRRPLFLICLLVLSLSCIGLALVPTSAYWLLLLLRCLQAAGGASTIALGAGVIGDIATRAERGGFFGLYTVGPLIGPAIGPVMGGGLSDGFGWRSIFWFMCIASSTYFVILLLLLPETLRSLVGDGSILPSKIYRPMIPVLSRGQATSGSNDNPSRPSVPNPFRILMYPDVMAQLIFNGVNYAVFAGVVATISTLFKATYPFLTETEIGLCYMAIGGGMMAGSMLHGKVLDWDYQNIKRQRTRHAEANPDLGVTSDMVTQDEHFPIERARLRLLPVFVLIFIGTVAGYGWCLEKKTSISAPLILHFFTGYTSIAMLNSTQTLLVDLLPSQGSSATACNNLMRCSLAAVLVSLIDVAVTALSPGWAFVLFAGLSVSVAPLLYVVVRIGPGCRAKRCANKRN